MYRNIVRTLRNVTSDVATAWIPEKPWVLVVSAVALWYGRKVGIALAPKIISKYLISSNVWGQYVVAPVATKTLAPYVIAAVAFLFFYTAAVIGNLVAAFFDHKTKPEKNACISIG